MINDDDGIPLERIVMVKRDDFMNKKDISELIRVSKIHEKENNAESLEVTLKIIKEIMRKDEKN